MKKNRRVRRLLAVILCMTLVLSSNIVSMAAEENGTEVQEVTETPVIEETEPVVADEPVPEDITEAEMPVTEIPETVPTEKPTEEPVDTEVPTETVTEPETPEVPETPAAPGVQEEPGAQVEDEHVGLEEIIYVPLVDGEYPPYLSSQGMGGGTGPRPPHEANKSDIYYNGEKWICCWYDENKDGAAQAMGPRNQHYIRIKYLNDVKGDIYAICYVRCDLYGGENPEKTYYPVFFIDETGGTLLEENNGRFWESVEKGKKPTKTPAKTSGYWTLGKYTGGLISKLEQLQQVTDTKKKVTPEKYSINTQTVFIWHETPIFTKVSEEKDDKGNNRPLEGAKFEFFLNGSSKGTATSDEEGKVSFTDLKPGKYTLTEIVTPEKYILPTKHWNVELTSDGKVTITGGDDGLLVEKTESEGYKIINRVENPLSCNKMVEVENEDNRTFQISLTIDSELSAEKKVSKIVDVIDSRFELVSGEKERLEEKYPNNISFETLKNNDLKITWTNNAAIIKPDNKGQHGWEEIIHIKAKDDFMGGNMIPTNGPNSGIYVDGDETIDLEFQKPTVNVKLLTITAEDITETVFLGDMINATQFPQELLEKVKIQKITKETFNIPSGCLPESLSSGHSVTKEYSYGSTNDVVGSFMYEFKPVKPENNPVTDHKANVKGDNVEQYQLTVKYQAIDRTQMDGYLPPEGTKQGESKVTSTYTINVVAGTIQITKKINGTFNPKLEGDPIFTFKITKIGTDGKTWYRTVRFSDETEKTVEVLSDLEKGEYEVTELTTGRYEFNDVDANGSNCKTQKINKGIKFYIGTPSGTDENHHGEIGAATFENNKNGNSGKRTDTDVRVNRFTKDENGNWTWTGDSLRNNQQ